MKYDMVWAHLSWKCVETSFAVKVQKKKAGQEGTDKRAPQMGKGRRTADAASVTNAANATHAVVNALSMIAQDCDDHGKWRG